MPYCSLLVFIVSTSTTGLALEPGVDESSAPAEAVKKTGPMQIKVVFQDKSKASGLSESVAYEVLCEGFKIAEGPIWDHANNQLLFSDVNSNEIHRWSADKGHGVFLEPSGNTGHAPTFAEGVLGSNGLFFDPQGKLVVCQHGDRRMAIVELTEGKPGKIETIVDRFDGKRFNSPNDLTIAKNGDIYFSDPPYGFLNIAVSNPNENKMVFDKELRELDHCGIYCWSAKDQTVRLLNKSMDFPNGMGLSADEKWLYVNSSDMGNPHINRYSTKTGEGGLFFNGPFGENDAGWFDGMKMHSNGNIYTAGPGGILVISPEGKKVATIPLPAPATNCCFGPDEKTMYITLFDSVAKLTLAE